MSVNKVILVGRIGQEIETFEFPNGSKTSFSLATSEKFTKKDGEKVEQTEWHNCYAWGKTGEVIEKYHKKGDQIYVEGKIKTRNYEAKDGSKRYVTEIEVLSFDFINSKPTANVQQNASNSMANMPDDESPF